MNPSVTSALQYIRNTGGSPTIAQFDDDHEPVGPMLRRLLLAAWMTYEHDSKVFIDPEYGEGTRGEVNLDDIIKTEAQI